MRFRAVVVAALLTLAPTTSAVATPLEQQSRDAGAARQNLLESQIFHEINALRRHRGLRALTVSGKLAAAAAQHTREMGIDGYFDHRTLDSAPFWKRIEHWYSSKNRNVWLVGENLAFKSPGLTAQQTVDMWMGSPPHRANLLDRTWREIGISAIHFERAPGIYEDAPVTIVTADFGFRR